MPEEEINVNHASDIVQIISDRTSAIDAEFQTKVKPVADEFFENLTQLEEKYNQKMKPLLKEYISNRADLIEGFKNIPFADLRIKEDLWIPDFSAEWITQEFEIYGFSKLFKYSDENTDEDSKDVINYYVPSVQVN